MTHRITATSIWTAVLAAIMALLASLGFAKAARADVASASPSSGAAASVATAPATAAARRSWRAVMRGGSLPPTIKQRIRAEAHGKSPSVRCSATAAAMGAGRGVPAEAGRDRMGLAA